MQLLFPPRTNMGNITMFRPEETVDELADIDATNRQPVRDTALTIYAVGAILFVPLWLAVVGWDRTRSRPAVTAGFAIGTVLLGLNMWQSQAETVGAYSVERSEEAALERNSFSLVVVLFAFGSMLSTLDRSVVSEVLPLIMATVFFAVVLVLAPIFVSTTHSVPIILMKHLKGVSTIYGLAFMTATLALIFTHERMRGGGFHLQGATNSDPMGGAGGGKASPAQTVSATLSGNTTGAP